MMAVSVKHPHPITFSPTHQKQKALISHFPQSQVGGPHHHLFSLQLLSADSCSVGAQNIFRLSQRQSCQFSMLYMKLSIL